VLVVILLVIALGVAITGVHLERNRLQSTADAVALAASQAYTEESFYPADRSADDPVGGTSTVAPRLGQADAERAAREHLQTYPPISTRTRDVHVDQVEVGPDGRVEVRLRAVTDPPLIGWLTRTGLLTIPLEVTGEARAS
jgi:Flp pilus assembly protein TadG